MKFPLIFAHRGANSFAPENTISAFEKAIDLGCDGIEVDVRFTIDQKIVVYHDRNTRRMTGRYGHIQKMQQPQIQELSIEHLGNNHRIPFLQDVLEVAADKCKIIIDVKREGVANNGFEDILVTLLKRMNLLEKVIISSFNPIVLKRIHALSPVHTGFIFRNRSSMMMLNGHPVKSLHARHGILSRRYINNLRNRAQNIYAWTVDEKDKMIKMIENEVDGIITNNPELLLQLKNEMYSFG